MFLKNLHFSWQFLKRNPLFFLINVLGLVIGITSALFIFIYVSFEDSYDRFHAGYEDIYPAPGIDRALGVSSNVVGIVMPPLGSAMEETIPEVVKTVRVRAQGDSFITVGDRKYDTNKLAFTEDSFFDVFSGFQLEQRQAGVLLNKPRSAVMTRSFAESLRSRELAGEVVPFRHRGRRSRRRHERSAAQFPHAARAARAAQLPEP